MIQSTTDFIKYCESIRCRTMNYIRVVPPYQQGWSLKKGEFTCAYNRFPDEGLNEPRFRPKGEGHPLKAWRWLMAMTEHEIHHCSQLAVYLSLVGVQPPHIFGMGLEDVMDVSVTQAFRRSQC